MKKLIYMLLAIFALCFSYAPDPSDQPQIRSITLDNPIMEVCVVQGEVVQLITNEQNIIWSTLYGSGARNSSIDKFGFFTAGSEVGTIWVYANKEDVQLGLINIGMAEVSIVNRLENCREESNTPNGSKWRITGFHEKQILHYNTSRLVGYRTNIDMCVELKGTKLIVINGSAYSEITDTLPYCDPVSITDNDMKISFISSDGLVDHNILSSFLLDFDKEPIITWHCISGDNLPEHTETEHCIDCIDNMNMFPSITAEDGATSEYVLINNNPTTYDDPYTKSSITITKGCGLSGTGNVTPNTCLSNDDCPSTEYCSSGSCAPVVVVCGQLSNHQTIPYECGSEPGCSVCVSGSCLNHRCVQCTILPPENASAGAPVNLITTIDGQPCASCDIQIIDSNGVISTVKTDPFGNAVVMLNTSGKYSIVLLRDGVVLANNSMDVAPSANPDTIDFKNIIGGSELLIISLIGVVIIITLVFLYIILTRGKKDKK